MRHLRSILYAVVLAPAVWVLSGVGFSHDRTGRVESAIGLLLVLLAGAAYAILVFAPISPAGPLLAGVVFLAVGVWSLAGPSTYADLWAPGVSKANFDLSRPGYGLAALLAVPLICTALSSRRWERYEPPQLPLIGTLGGSRGVARPAGVPVAVMETAVMQKTEESDATVVMRPSAARDEPTVVVVADEEPDGAEEITTAYAVSSSGEITTTAVPVVAADDGDEPSEDEAASAVDDGETTEPMTLADRPTEPVVAVASGEEATVEVDADTRAVDGDDEDKTQVIRLPLSELSTDDLRRIPGERVTHNIDDGGRTQVIGPGERTQVIARDNAEDTQVIHASRRTPSADSDGERTQVIRPGTGTVEPPGDRTQVLKLPTGEATTERRETPSILDSERPNPGDDPTTLLVPPGHTDPGEETTVDVGDAKKRIMTVMNLERPAGEAADDTRRLVTPPPPRQRRPDDETS